MVCVCVCPINLTSHICSLNNQLNKSYRFPFLFMILAIDSIDGYGLSNEVCYEFLPKKSKVNAVLAVHSQEAFNQLLLTR